MGALWTTSASLYYQGTGVGSGTSMGSVANPTILDGNPVGTWNTMSLSGLGTGLSGLTVTLNVSGGVNSGLYAYLVHDGVLAVLLNRPGVSAGTPLGNLSSGFNTSYTTLDANNTVSPLAAAAAFTGSGPATSLATTFGSTSLNGDWTLFFADVVNGGGNATLTGWSLDITAVPEPVNVALAAFGTLLLTVFGVRNVLRRHRAA